MSRTMEEVIRIKLESMGVQNVDALVDAFRELEQSGEFTQAEMGGLVDKINEVTAAAGDVKGIEAAIDSYKSLGEQQAQLRSEVERTGLALELAAQQERGASDAYSQTKAATAEARQALEEYRKSADRTREGLEAHRNAVRDAVQAEREAKTAYNDSSSAMAQAFKAFDGVDNRLAGVIQRLSEAGKAITDAGLSTDDLAKSQTDLAARATAAGDAVGKMVSEAREAAKQQRELARATEEAAAAADKAARDFDDAFRALGGSGAIRDTAQEIERLETAYETLAKSGKLSAEQLARAQEQLQQRIQRLREGTAEYRAEQERAAQAQAQAAAGAAELARETAKAADESKEFADGVKRLESSTKSAAAGQEQLGSAVQRNTGIFDKLKGVLASVTAYLGFREAVEGVKNILSIGDAAEGTRLRFTQLFGSIEAGNAAMVRIRDIARDNGLAFQQTADAAARMKSFGLDPLNGSMQALIDQNAALGGSQQTLEGIILAVGQAWAKQKLQGEEILQLVERGVPVWDLLAKATGLNVGELQKMSEQGLLTRDVIAQLMVEMGKANEGAAAAGLSRLSTLITGLREQYVQFAEYVNNSGTFEYFRSRLLALNQTIDTMVRDGRMAQWARQVSDAIVGAARAMESGVRWVVEYSGAILGAVKAYAAFKAIDIATTLSNTALGWLHVATNLKTANAQATAATGMFGKLGATLRAIPLNLKIAVAVVGYEVLDATARKLAEIAARNSAANKEYEKVQAERKVQWQEEINALYRLQDETIRYRDVQVKTATESAKLSAEEIESYKARLKGAQEYASQQMRVVMNERMLRGQTDETNKAVNEAIARVKELRGAWDLLAEGAKLAADATKNSLSIDATAMVAELERATTAANTTKTALAAMFADIDTTGATRLGDMALAIAKVGEEGGRSGKLLREGLTTELEALTGEQLLKFSTAAQAAFAEFNTGAERAAFVADQVLLTAMERLGLEGAQLGVPFTESGKDIIATFQTIAESANATSEQIRNAFAAALSSVGTKAEVEALEAALNQAFRAGKIGAEELARSMADLQRKMGEVDAAVDPLRTSFEALGITSQKSLETAAAAARAAFDDIKRGAREGEASMADARRAFEAYARAQLDAASGLDRLAQDQIRRQLELEARSIGATEALERLGLVGKDAGDKTADAMGAAAESLHGVADAADAASSGLRDVGSAGAQAASSVSEMAAAYGNMRSESVGANVQLSETSKLFQDIIAGRERSMSFGPVDLFRDYQEQNAELSRHVELLQEQNMSLDEVGRRVLELREQYRYLSDDRLRTLAQEQIRYEQATGQTSEQNRQLSTGNDLLRDRNALLDRQQAQQAQTPATVERVYVLRLEAAVGRVEFDMEQMTERDKRSIAEMVLSMIGKDR